jgi:hypothetical protein
MKPGKRYLKILVALLLPFIASAQSVPEHEVKAAYIFNFSKFIEWPADAFKSANAPINVGIVGDSSVASSLQRIVRNQTVEGRPITVRQVGRESNLVNYHIIFVGRSESDRARQIISGVQRHGILTIGDSPNFLREGGVINLFLEGNKLRFEINTLSAERSSLKISSKLLKLAKITRV